MRRHRRSRPLDRVQEYLDRFKRADERQNASSTLMIPFALSEDGHKLEKHLNAQRRYLSCLPVS